MPLALMLFYPLCVHMAVVTGYHSLQTLSLVCLAAGIQYSGLRQGQLFSWSVLALTALVGAWLSSMDLVRYLLYVPPIVIPLLIWTGFMRTLLPGQVPLVTAIGQHVHGDLPDDIERYTHRVTVFWAVFLALLSLWSAVLPWIGSPLVWSLFSNFINYALVALLFIAEFFYRRLRFPYFEQPGFRRYLHIVFESAGRRT